VITDHPRARASSAASKCDSFEQQVANNYAISVHHTPVRTLESGNAVRRVGRGSGPPALSIIIVVDMTATNITPPYRFLTIDNELA